jgi:hypothetical protein
MFLAAKNCCTDKALCTGTFLLWGNKSWSHHLSECFQWTCSLRHCKPSGINAGNHLAWRNKFLMNNAVTVKRDHQHDPDAWPDLPHFLLAWRGQAFPLRGLLFGFWVTTVNSGFIFCCDPQEEVLVISDFIQQFLADKHMLLLLLICEQLRHKLHGDLLCVEVLH